MFLDNTEAVGKRATRQVQMRVNWLCMRFESSGRVNRWLAPALRGLILKPLRETLCLLSPDEQRERRSFLRHELDERYCRDCLRMPECLYGLTFEPDRSRIGDGMVIRGAREGVRALTIATQYPFESQQPASAIESSVLAAEHTVDAHEGDSVFLRVLQIGRAAQDLLPVTIAALNQRGQQRGLGPDRVRFSLENMDAGQEHWILSGTDLPMKLSNGVVPRLRLVLQTPLFIKTEGSGTEIPTENGRKRGYAASPSTAPSFAELFQQSLRTVRRAMNEYGYQEWGMDTDFMELRNAARGVDLIENQLVTIRQPRSSSRQGARWLLSGWSGGMTFSNVPISLIPYLQWGGRLGVGDSRNCGAGLWMLQLD